jgi:hypothetical protein
LAALAEGRLHLTAVLKLAPLLTPENADELIHAATHKTKEQLDALPAERFAPPDLMSTSNVIHMASVQELSCTSAPARIEEAAEAVWERDGGGCTFIGDTHSGTSPADDA